MRQFVTAIVVLCAGCLGAALLRWPRQMIAWQIACYRRINWQMEPVSWPKEIRNTRLMGLMVIVVGGLAIVVLLVRGAP